MKVVPCEIAPALEKYSGMLLKWNMRINLLGGSAKEDLQNRHLDDSLQLANLLLTRGCFGKRVLDIGSGNGLPGIPMALMGLDVTMVESVRKKGYFLEECVRSLGLGSKVLICRIEEVVGHYDVITARAIASINSILHLTKELHPQAYYLLKGTSYKKELMEAKSCWSFDCEELDSITAADAKILIIKNCIRR